jgi:hypothetical protein
MKNGFCLLIAALIMFPALAGFSQTALPTDQGVQGNKEVSQRLTQIKDLYTKAEYTSCKAAIDTALIDFANGKLPLSSFDVAEIYIYKALVVYAFREEGFQKEIETLLQKAVELDINYDFKDYAIIPTYLIDKFVKIKQEYLARFAKSTRRHCLGLYGVISYLPMFSGSSEYLIPGIHYSFNPGDNFTLLLDFESPLSSPIFNIVQFRVGTIWFPTFKVETISMGLGAFYSLRIENGASYTHIVAIEGYGEFILRVGFGVAASVELVKLSVLTGSGTLAPVGYFDIFSSEKSRFSFANLRVYLFYTF